MNGHIGLSVWTVAAVIHNRRAGLRLAATGLVVLASLFYLGVVLAYEPSTDIHSYLHAAELLANGDRLYNGGSEAWHAYLYAPWFAYALIPGTWAPAIFIPLWHGFLVACLAVTLWPLIRTRRIEGVLAAVIIGPFGWHGVWIGHVEPAMVAMLVLGLPTRFGPVAIGVAASLKIAPIMLALVYVGRGEWSKAAISFGVAGVLWSHALLFDLSRFLSTSHGTGIGPLLFIGLAAGSLAALVFARSRYAWLAGSVAWLVSMPLVRPYDLLGLAAGSVDARESLGAGEDAQEPEPDA